MNESDFLTTLAKRLGRSTPLASPPKRDFIGAPEFWQEYRLPLSEQIQTFKTELEKLGGCVEIYHSLDELQAGLAEILHQLSPQTIVTWGGDSLSMFQLENCLQEYETVAWDGLSEPLLNADVGITGVDFAIADTGSIVLMSSLEKGRSVSLLPTVHIALIPSSKFRTRLGEVLEEIGQLNHGPGRMPSSINIITGPSRSSDIENDLSIGVHGPVALYALILNEGLT
jgi:L-lactate dehydrogenase complex protein LldG